MFKEVEIQLKLYATEKEEREKEKCWFCILLCQEDLEFEGGETMWYEAKKLWVMPVSGEIERVRTPFFLGLICIYQSKYGILSGLAKTIPYGPVFKPERNNHVSVLTEVSER